MAGERPYPYKPSGEFPYGRDRQYVERNMEQIYGLGAGRLRNNIHGGAMDVVERMQKNNKPSQEASSRVMQNILGGTAPKWEWNPRHGSGSHYNPNTATVNLNPDDYKQYGMPLPLHEAMHGLQAGPGDAPAMAAHEQRYGEDVYRMAKELAPAIGGVVANAQASLPSRADDIHWQMGDTYDPSVEYLRGQAERYGVMAGKSIDQLISENPQFLQLLARQDQVVSAPSMELQPPTLAVRANNTPNLQSPNLASQDMTQMPGANRTYTRAQPQVASQYGLAPRASSPTPQPTYSKPVAPMAQPAASQALAASSTATPRTPSQSLSPSVPWVNHPVYNSVPVAQRAAVANRMDPESYYQATSTPAQRAMDTANRSEGMLRTIQADPNRGGARYGARQQYQYSPANSALVGLNAREEQAREQARADQLAAYRQFGLQRDARIAGDKTAQARYKDMGNTGAIDPARYRQQLGEATAQYNTYARAARISGQQPISFDSYLSQYGSGQMSPEIRDTLQQGRALNRATYDQPSRGPSLQFAQYMNQRYGLPMALPSDPQQAQQWQNSLAMQGNPYAMQTNMLAQQNAAQMYKDSQQQMADLQKTMAQEAASNYRTGLQYGARPVSLTPDQHAQIIGEWTKNDPVMRSEQVRQSYIDAAKASGAWNDTRGDGVVANRLRIQDEAQRKGEEAGAMARANRQMMSQNPVFGPVVGGGPAVGQTPTSAAPQGRSGFNVFDSIGQWLGSAKPPAGGNSNAADINGVYKDIPVVPPPQDATPEEIHAAYSSLKQAFGGQDPTPQQVSQELAKSGKAIRQAQDGEMRPYYEYSTRSYEGPHAAPYKRWLDANKTFFGAEPPADPTWQYAPGNFTGF